MASLTIVANMKKYKRFLIDLDWFRAMCRNGFSIYICGSSLMFECDKFLINYIEFNNESSRTRKMGPVAISRWESLMIKFFYDWFEWHHVRAPNVDWTEHSIHQRSVTNGGHTFIGRIFVIRDTKWIVLQLETVMLFNFFLSICWYSITQ